MVNINLTMQMDDSLQLFVDDLEDVDSNGMNLILGRVRRDIIRFLQQRYGSQPQDKGHGLAIQATGYLKEAIRAWEIVEDGDGGASLVWNGGQKSAVQEGQYASTPWSQIYFINKGRAGWGGDNPDYDDPYQYTAYSEPRNKEGKVDLQKYLDRKIPDTTIEGRERRKKSGIGKDFVSPREAERQFQMEDKGDDYGFDPDDMGPFRYAIYEWANAKGLSEYWAAIANQIAKQGSQGARPTFTDELLGSEFPNGEATTGSLLKDIIDDAIDAYLKGLLTPQTGKKTAPVQVANVAINIRGRWQVAKGQTITIGDKVYGGGQFLPKGTYGQSAQGFQIT